VSLQFSGVKFHQNYKNRFIFFGEIFKIYEGRDFLKHNVVDHIQLPAIFTFPDSTARCKNPKKTCNGSSYIFIEVVVVDVLDRKTEHLGREFAHLSRQRVALLQLWVWTRLVFVFLLVGRRSTLMLALLRQIFRCLFLLSA